MKTTNNNVRYSDRFRLDNVWYEVDWSKFIPGTSIFVPTLRTDIIRNRLYEKGIVNPRDIDTRVVIENGVYGVRIWRLR